MSGMHFVEVDVQGERHLVRVSDVVELLLMMRLSHLAGSAGLCRGLIDLRGEPVPVFDLAGPDAPLTPDRFIVVIDSERRRLGFIVDDVHRVIEVPLDRVSLVPVGKGHVRMVAQHGEALYPVIEPELVVADVR